jgi:hypothetical protein
MLKEQKMTEFWVQKSSSFLIHIFLAITWAFITLTLDLVTGCLLDFCVFLLSAIKGF